MSWSFCRRSNQSAPNCTYTAPLTGSSQQNQWSHSSRCSGERGARWEPATLCRRPMWITTGAILGCTPLSWATSWRNVSLQTVARMQGHHDNHVVAAEYKTVGCFILLLHGLELKCIRDIRRSVIPGDSDMFLFFPFAGLTLASRRTVVKNVEITKRKMRFNSLFGLTVKLICIMYNSTCMFSRICWFHMASQFCFTPCFILLLLKLACTMMGRKFLLHLMIASHEVGWCSWHHIKNSKIGI